MDRIKKFAQDCARDAMDQAADVDSLDPQNFPLPADWEAFRVEFPLSTRTQDRAEDRFQRIYRATIREAQNDI